MKALIQKELRQNLKIAVIGLVMFTLALIYLYHNCISTLTAAIEVSRSIDIGLLQPLLESKVLLASACFCAIFGVLLGWVQVCNERHRDLWAFLIHRPVTRTDIFLGKTIAGFCLYVLGAGLPLIGLVTIVRVPGQVAAPFEWAMALPVTASFLMGLVCYLAGMLTGLRQARWYASRGLGLGLALVASVAVFGTDEFYQALLVIVIPGAALAVATWGSHQTGGFYRGQPVAGKLALIVAGVVSSAIVLWAAVWLVSALVTPPATPPATPHSTYTSSQYQLTKDGSICICKETYYRGSNAEEIVDLKGKPLVDEKTGQTITTESFKHRRSSYAAAIVASFDTPRPRWDQHGYQTPSRFFTLLSVTNRTLWYATREGTLTGYDEMTRHSIGNLEPRLSSDEVPTHERFPYPPVNYYFRDSSDQPPLLATATTIYEVIWKDRALIPLFAVRSGDQIGGYARTRAGPILVATRKTIQFLDTGGKPLWSVPYEPSYPDYSGIRLSYLEPTNHFALWFRPDYERNLKTGLKMPTHVSWLTATEGVTSNTVLPELAQPPELTQPGKEVAKDAPILILAPPAYTAAVFITEKLSELIWLSVIPAAICVAIGWWLGRRYSFSRGAKVGWGVFHLLLGIPGMLAFLSVQEWPAREQCPDCKRLRPVDQKHCEHCGAAFAPLAKNGTEIFEPLEVTPR